MPTIGNSAPFPVYGGRSYFVAKFTSTGTFLWVQTNGSPGHADLVKVKYGHNGEIFMVGKTIIGGLSFGNGLATTDSSSFILKMDASGLPVWLQQVNGNIDDLEVDHSGNPFISGNFSGVLTIGGQTFSGSASNLSPFVAKLSGAGAVLWTKSSLNVGAYSFYGRSSISLDASGNCYHSAQFMGTVTFDNSSAGSGLGTNSYAARFDASGNLSWLRSLNSSSDPNTGLAPTSMATDSVGNTLIGAGFYGEITLDTITMNADPGNWLADAVLFRIGPTGNVLSAVQGTSQDEVSISDVALGRDNKCYVTGALQNWLIPVGGITFGGINENVEGGFVFKFSVLDSYNHIGGKVFYDNNHNGIQDSGDALAPQIVIQSNIGYSTSSNPAGLYKIATDSGSYVVTLPAPPTYYNVTPASHFVSFNGYGISDTSRHFALQPIPNQQDLQITLTPITVPRPGFNYPLNITYRNIGTTTLTGSVEIQLDYLLLFQNSSPAQTSMSGNNLTWNFTNLQPTQTATIIVNTQVPATAILGTTINQTASVSPITGDLTPADNVRTDSAIVVGAYDPNDKQVNHTSLTPTQVANEEWLEYIIRFQNTGTDTAFTVRIADTLSAMLNIPTIELLAASHAYTWNIKGAGIIEWRFDNILLPDSNTNEPESHGFVKFRIKPNNDLALGDVIENTAHIYFDFNEAIITNTTTTEVRLPSSVATRDNNPLRIYPNPSKGQFTVQCSNIRASQVQAEIRNVLGQVVWQQSLPVENGNLQQVVRTNGLSKGVYYLQVKTDRQSKVQKVVLE